jgi:hypothetical protein
MNKSHWSTYFITLLILYFVSFVKMLGPEMLLQWNLDALFLKGMENKDDVYRKTIFAGNH